MTPDEAIEAIRQRDYDESELVDLAVEVLWREIESLRAFKASVYEQELESLRAFKAGVDEALNSGDGVYRP